ncbi:E3 ubiquitin-protein ligase arc-1-like [Saccostrea echinata]|uniref:E3 ubiquitin-protein ligase arc-1-like n=1 Tax=Saccostrea echinata TaxID=191078 RepID=UPI002A80F6E2|nr:E3 ubiquitin-protein ligase arc-1-like [Saccostrea echinata]
MFMIIVSTQFKIRQCSQCQGDTEFYCDKCKHDLCLQCKERHVTNFPTKYHKVVFYKAHRSEKSLIKQCKMRQCFQCQGDTEFYCNTCKHDLCLQCKDRHVIDLSTKHHDIVIYLEKYENILKQEKCVRHPDRIYETYCQSCELSLCSQCKEHRKHQIQDIRTAYKTNRQQHRDYFHNIRSETLYNSCFFLAGIKTDMKACRSEISNRRSEILSKAQRLKDLIDTVVVDIIVGLRKYMLHRLQNQKRKMKRHLVNIENYEHRSKWSGIRQIKILLFVKKTLDPKIKDNLNLTQHVFLSLSKEINTEDVMKLGEIQIIQKGIRQIAVVFGEYTQ